MDKSYWMDPLAPITAKARNGDLSDVAVREWGTAPRVVSHRFTRIGTRCRKWANDDS